MSTDVMRRADARHAKPSDVGLAPKLMIGALVALAVITSWLVFLHTDVTDTLDGGVLLLELITKGGFRSFYQYAAENSADSTVWTANYNVLMYAVFMVWNLPAGILHITQGFDYLNSTWALLWCKSLIIVCLGGIAWGIWKIAEELGAERDGQYFSTMTFLTSCCVFVGALISAQYDAIMLLLEVWGVYFYLRRKNKLFLAFFALAIPFKLFAIFLLLPLLCLREKNLLKVFGLTAVAFIPNLLLGLPFRNSAYYQMAVQSQNSDALDILLSRYVTGGILPVFIAIYVLICLWCYFYESDGDDGYRAIYVAFAVFASFDVFVPIRPYWIILYVPFASVLIGSRRSGRIAGMLTEALAGVAGSLYHLETNWVFNSNSLCTSLALKSLAAPSGYEYRYEGWEGLFTHLGLDDAVYALLGVFAAGMIGLAILYFPRESLRDSRARLQESKRPSLVGPLREFRATKRLEYLVLLLRTFLVLFVVGGTIYACTALQPAIAYGSDEVYTIDSSSDDLQEMSLFNGDVLTVYGIRFSEDRGLTEFGVLLHYQTHDRKVRVVHHFSLIDEASGETVWSGDLPATLVEDGEYNVLEMNDVQVYSEREYRLEMSSTVIRTAESNVSVVLNDDGVPAIYFR